MSNPDSSRTEVAQRQVGVEFRPAGPSIWPPRPDPATSLRSTDIYGCVDWFDYGQHDHRDRAAS